MPARKGTCIRDRRRSVFVFFDSLEHARRRMLDRATVRKVLIPSIKIREHDDQRRAHARTHTNQPRAHTRAHHPFIKNADTPQDIFNTFPTPQQGEPLCVCASTIHVWVPSSLTHANARQFSECNFTYDLPNYTRLEEKKIGCVYTHRHISRGSRCI